MLLSKTSCLAVILCLAALATSALSQDDQPKSSRNSLLLRRGNGGRPNPLAKSTTTTPQPEYSDDEYVDEDGERPEGDEGDEPAPGRGPILTTTTTTTESPKKIRPTIRPFRSNEDLLTALKKRRQESKNQKPAPPKEKVYDDEDVPAPAPAKSAKAPAIGKIADNVVFALTKPVTKGRRFGAAARKDVDPNAAPSEQSEETNNGGDNNAAKSLTSRLGRSRFALKQ
ncbi:uncharacterized protein LOC128745344 isoform X1 [Sabethes cyaneus]|uniref:uncharacterized protein LOC128745344 isoform X1 n=1 Tax=Sabethes cyaneus TaxID=53552 RepID=UPI00237E3C41|nr:uncharacterized protein LOC128745344 isoform X1 [Sabethes cyaneus]